MSTPQRIKEARMKAHQEQKAKRRREKLFASSKKPSGFEVYVPPRRYIRETPDYPSVTSTGQTNCEKKDSTQYSGDYLVGIATMHKSNAVPVGRNDNPTNYSTMRRN